MSWAAVSSALRDAPAVGFAPSESPEGRAWIDGLGSLVQSLLSTWRLDVASDRVDRGHASVVVHVRRDDQPLALKVAWPGTSLDDEVAALRTWGGRGAVVLIDAAIDRGALLLEHLDADRSLSRAPLDEAARVAGRLIRRLAVPTTHAHHTTSDEAAGLVDSLPTRQRALGDPIPPRWLAMAVATARQLSSEGTVGSLVHADLHFGNVLASSRPGDPWVAIDPKPRIGAPERSVAELTWTRVDELDTAADVVALVRLVADAGGLDAELAGAWAFVRSIDYWLWCVDRGLTVDPTRCRRVAGALEDVVG